MESDIDAIFVSFPSSSEIDRKSRDEWFVGDVAEWAKIRTRRFGDLIIAKHMYIEWVYGDRHSAAWLEHAGEDPDTGERYHVHHVVCDCVRDRDPGTVDGGEGHFSCQVLHNALTERARKIDKDYRVYETLRVLRDMGAEEYHDMVLCVMENTLVLDKDHPDYWMGNVVSGEHQVDLMGEILHIPAESVRLYADILKLNDKIDFSGEILKLKEAA